MAMNKQYTRTLIYANRLAPKPTYPPIYTYPNIRLPRLTHSPIARRESSAISSPTFSYSPLRYHYTPTYTSYHVPVDLHDHTPRQPLTTRARYSLTPTHQHTQGYLKALGMARTAQVKRDARIGEALAKKEAGIRVGTSCDILAGFLCVNVACTIRKELFAYIMSSHTIC